MKETFHNGIRVIAPGTALERPQSPSFNKGMKTVDPDKERLKITSRFPLRSLCVLCALCVSNLKRRGAENAENQIGKFFPGTF